MEYGRRSDAGTWFQIRPVGKLGAVLLAAVTAVAVAEYQYARAPVLQRLYLPMYVRATVLSTLGWPTAGLYPVESTGVPYPAGAVQPPANRARYRHHDVALWIQAAIFDGQRLLDLALPILWWTVGVGLACLVPGVLFDRQRARERRQGRHLRGPEFVSTREFTKRIQKEQW